MADELSRLAEVTANLDAYINTRASQIAAARIAAIQESVDNEIAELKAKHAQERQQAEDLIRELRRQLTPLLRHVEQCPETIAGRARREESGQEHELLLEAAAKVIDAQRVDQNWIQRHVRVGFVKAGRLLELLEEVGVIGPIPATRSGQRQVLIPQEQKDEALARLRSRAEQPDAGPA